MLSDDRALFELLAALLALLAGGFALVFLARRLGAVRDGLDLCAPLAAALGVRILAVAATAIVGEDLRTTDDAAYFDEADDIADTPGEWVDRAWGESHVTLFAFGLRVLDGPDDTVLRVVQALIAVAAIALLAAAVHDLAGRRAALVTAWVAALEPSGVLFSTELHKESLLLLALGLTAFGAARTWTRRDLPGVATMAAGGALALTVRQYAGVALLVAAGLVLAHAWCRDLGPGRPRRLLLGGTALAAIVVAVLTAPLYLDDRLRTLQNFQDSPSPVNNNLQLDPVELTTYSGLLEAIPKRTVDFLFRPLPWQPENLNQALGAAGTLLAWLVYAAVLAGLSAGGRRLWARAGPAALPDRVHAARLRAHHRQRGHGLPPPRASDVPARRAPGRRRLRAGGRGRAGTATGMGEAPCAIGLGSCPPCSPWRAPRSWRCWPPAPMTCTAPRRPCASSPS